MQHQKDPPAGAGTHPPSAVPCPAWLLPLIRACCTRALKRWLHSACCAALPACTRTPTHPLFSPQRTFTASPWPLRTSLLPSSASLRPSLRALRARTAYCPTAGRACEMTHSGARGATGQLLREGLPHCLSSPAAASRTNSVLLRSRLSPGRHFVTRRDAAVAAQHCDGTKCCDTVTAAATP